MWKVRGTLAYYINKQGSNKLIFGLGLMQERLFLGTILSIAIELF